MRVVPNWKPALIALTIAYVLYIPLPADNVLDRVKIHVMEIGMRLAYFYPMQALKALGPDWQIWWARHSLVHMARILHLRTWLQPDDVKVSYESFDGVPVVVHEPRRRRSNGAIVFMHGGGFVYFDADSYNLLARQLAAEVGVVVFNVDYRLAPEHVFPAALDDCDKAISYLLSKAANRYSIDPNHVALIGDSAGGNLAAGSAFRLIEKPSQTAKPKLQVLMYPLLQFIDFQTPSYYEADTLYAGSSLPDPDSIARVFSFYIGLSGIETDILRRNDHLRKDSISERAPFILDDMQHHLLPFNHSRSSYSNTGKCDNSTDSALGYFSMSSNQCPNEELVSEIRSKLEPYVFNPEISPMVREDLSKSPKTMLITCQYDPLRDEGFWYARRLQKAGVNVTWKHYEHAFHGIITLHEELNLAQRMFRDVVEFLIENL